MTRAISRILCPLGTAFQTICFCFRLVLRQHSVYIICPASKNLRCWSSGTYVEKEASLSSEGDDGALWDLCVASA